MKASLAIKTIGCRLNQAESQELAEALARSGFDVVSEKVEADLLVVNTCAVTQSATRKSRQALRAYHYRWPKTKIVVLGCSEPELRRLPEVDLAIAKQDKKDIVGLIIARYCHEKKIAANPSGDDTRRSPGRLLPASAPAATRTRALVKIQDGCDEFCTYCIVPLRRGRPVSLPAARILSQVKRLEAGGAKEIVLTGVHIGRYHYRGLALAGLIKRVLAETRIPRIRLSSIEPQHLTTEILQLLHLRRVCPFIHLPIQSGSDRILPAMGRHYTVKRLISLIKRIRAAVPAVFLSTDVIVGFPGESPADSEETVKFCRQMDFAKIHVFSYSKREGTSAARLSRQVPAAIIAARSRKLRRLSDQLNFQYRRRLKGKRLEILLETPHMGTSREGVKVRFAEKSPPNILTGAKITVITPRETIARRL